MLRTVGVQAAGLGDFDWDLERDHITISPRMAAMTGMRTGRTDGSIVVGAAIRAAALGGHRGLGL